MTPASAAGVAWNRECVICAQKWLGRDDDACPACGDGPPANHSAIASDMLMACADYLAATLPENVDPRAWSALLIYAPKEIAK